MTNGLIPSTDSVQGGRVTVFPCFRDQETKDAVNALLILRTTPLDATTYRDVHRVDDEDDKIIDAESLSEHNQQARSRTPPKSEESAYVGDQDFEIGTIRTEDGPEPVSKLMWVLHPGCMSKLTGRSLNLPPNEEVGPGTTYRLVKKWMTSREGRRCSFLADKPK
jgi:hypothetical protein